MCRRLRSRSLSLMKEYQSFGFGRSQLKAYIVISCQIETGCWAYKFGKNPSTSTSPNILTPDYIFHRYVELDLDCIHLLWCEHWSFISVKLSIPSITCIARLCNEPRWNVAVMGSDSGSTSLFTACPSYHQEGRALRARVVCLSCEVEVCIEAASFH